jgi:hypothetical protein
VRDWACTEAARVHKVVCVYRFRGASDVTLRLLVLGISIVPASSVASRPQPASPVLRSLALARSLDPTCGRRRGRAGLDQEATFNGGFNDSEVVSWWCSSGSTVGSVSKHAQVAELGGSVISSSGRSRRFRSMSRKGAYSRGKNRQVRYQTALASAREALACWETAQALGWVGPLDPEIGALFQRVIGTLVRLAGAQAGESLRHD